MLIQCTVQRIPAPVIPATYAPIAPVVGSVFPANQTVVALEWPAVPNASHYTVMGREAAPGQTARSWQVWVYKIIHNRFEKGGLQPGTQYEWEVIAQNESGEDRSTSFAFAIQPENPLPGAFNKLYPVDGQTDIPKEVTLQWSLSADAAHYEVFLGEAPTLLTNRGTATQTQMSLSLDAQKAYYWQVIAVNAHGLKQADNTSSVWMFETVPHSYSAPMIALIEPENGATDLSNPATLTWIATPGTLQGAQEREVALTEYRVFIRKEGDTVSLTATTSQMEWTTPLLEPGTIYCWEVHATQSDGQWTRSAESTFTIMDSEYEPPDISLLEPIDDAFLETERATLTWVATPGSLKTSGSRESQILEFLVYFGEEGEEYGEPATTTQTEWVTPLLVPETVYRWKVEAVQSDGQRAETDERIFTTEEAEYAVPQIELLLPAVCATDQATLVTLTWDATPGAALSQPRDSQIIGYRVYFAPSSQTTYGSPATTVQKSWATPQLQYNVMYKWKVDVVQSDGQWTVSEERFFTTVSTPVAYNPPQLALVAPSNEAIVDRSGLTLTWAATPGTLKTAGARSVAITGFRLYLAVVGQAYPAPITTTQSSYQPVNLEPNTEYRWYVVAEQSDGQETVVAPAWIFSTAGEAFHVANYSYTTYPIFYGRVADITLWDLPENVTALEVLNALGTPLSFPAPYVLRNEIDGTVAQIAVELYYNPGDSEVVSSVLVNVKQGGATVDQRAVTIPATQHTFTAYVDPEPMPWVGWEVYDLYLAFSADTEGMQPQAYRFQFSAFLGAAPVVIKSMQTGIDQILVSEISAGYVPVGIQEAQTIDKIRITAYDALGTSIGYRDIAIP